MKARASVGASHLRRRPKITDQIVAAIREEIVSGQFPAGARLPTERELAQRFSVSQPTIREVLRALDAIGLVDVRHGSGTYVAQNSSYGAALALQNLLQLQQVGIMEVLDVREVLGRESARRAALFATAEDVERIEHALSELATVASVKSVEVIIGRIIAFQVAISAAAHNPLLHSLESFLINLLLMIQSGPLGDRGARYWQKRSSGFQLERTAIFKAVKSGNAEAASAAFGKYLQHQRETFKGDPDLRALKVTDPTALSISSAIVLKSREKKIRVV